MDKFTYLVGDNGKTVIINDGVTTIPSKAFYENNVVEKIVVPDSVTTIERCSFGFCTSLKEVILPEGLKEIGVEAFIRCTSLVNVKIPGSVQAIGEGAFSNCSSLKEVILPEGLKEIDKYVFARCTNLKNVKIPDSVQAIGEGTFFKCLSLENIKLPENLKEIKERAFSDCTSLNSMNIPDSVDTIGKSSFSSCTSLKEVILPKGLNSIKTGVFENCTNLYKIIIPDSVDFIGVCAFSKCSSLEEVVLPDGLVTIENFGFSDCTSLDRMEIPSSVNFIGYSAFKGCTSLVEVTLSHELEPINIGTFAFNNCTNLKNVKISEAVKIIKNGSFSHCTSLKEVVLPDSLVAIDSFSFSGCIDLEKMEIPDSVDFIGVCAFSGCLKLKKITIKYREYEELKKLLINSESWLADIEKYQSIELVGPNLNIIQKISIMYLLKKNSPSFINGSIKNEKEETQEEKYDGTELELLRDKIKKISEDLPDKIKNNIKGIEEGFLKEYGERYDVLRPKFGDFLGPIKLEFVEDVESLNSMLISNLKMIIATLANAENTVNFLKELNEYKKLLHEGTNELSEGSDTKDIINNIVYISGKMGDKFSEYLNELSNHIDDAIKGGSLELENAFKSEVKLPVLDYTTKFKLNVSNLYDKVKNRYETVKVYMEILDCLSTPENSYQGEDNLISRVGSVKYIIANKIASKKLKEELEEQLNEFIKKYTDIINNILNNEILLKTTNPGEIKINFLKELGLIIANLNSYVQSYEHETNKKNGFLEELNKAKDIVTNSKIVDENSANGYILRYVIEINNKWVKDSTIKKSDRDSIKNNFLERINKSLEIFDETREELISYIEEERNNSMDKLIEKLPKNDNELLKRLKESSIVSSRVFWEENLELYDWNLLALKIIFSHLASVDLYNENFLKNNNEYVSSSLLRKLAKG